MHHLKTLIVISERERHGIYYFASQHPSKHIPTRGGHYIHVKDLAYQLVRIFTDHLAQPGIIAMPIGYHSVSNLAKKLKASKRAIRSAIARLQKAKFPVKNYKPTYWSVHEQGYRVDESTISIVYSQDIVGTIFVSEWPPKPNSMKDWKRLVSAIGSQPPVAMQQMWRNHLEKTEEYNAIRR